MYCCHLAYSIVLMLYCYSLSLHCYCCSKDTLQGRIPHFHQGGSGSNFLCLPEDPQWKTYLAESQAAGAGIIAGTEYQLFKNYGIRGRNNIFSERNNGGNPLYIITRHRVQFATWEVGQQSS